MNDNNHRTRIDRFKGAEVSLARKGKRLVARDGNVEKTNGELLSSICPRMTLSSRPINFSIRLVATESFLLRYD